MSAPRIIIDRVSPNGARPLWRFQIEHEDGTIMDHSLSSARWLAWRMACISWRRIMRGGAARTGAPRSTP